MKITDHYPATCLDTDSNPGRRGDKRMGYPLSYVEHHVDLSIYRILYETFSD